MKKVSLRTTIHCWLKENNLSFEAAYLPTADGQGPVKHRPGNGLFTSWSCHRPNIAVVIVELPR